MPAFPTITTNVSPVTVTSTGTVSYEEMVQSLGPSRYLVKGVYLQSENLAQLLETIRVSMVNANGVDIGFVEVPDINIFQKVKAIVLDWSKKGIILDGQTYLNLNIAANANEKIVFYVEE